MACNLEVHVITLDGVAGASAPADPHRALARLRPLFRSVRAVPGVRTGALAGSGLTAGQRGCAIAHRDLWRQLRDHPPGPHLVLEDDAFSRHPEALCEQLRAARARVARDDLDVLNLGPCGRSSSVPGGPHRRTAGCTHAYLISQRGLRRALRLTDTWSHPIDEEIFKLCAQGELACDSADLFGQRSAASEVRQASLLRPRPCHSSS